MFPDESRGLASICKRCKRPRLSSDYFCKSVRGPRLSSDYFRKNPVPVCRTSPIGSAVVGGRRAIVARVCARRANFNVFCGADRCIVGPYRLVASATYWAHSLAMWQGRCPARLYSGHVSLPYRGGRQNAVGRPPRNRSQKAAGALEAVRAACTISPTKS